MFDFILILGTIILFVLSGFISGVREWWRSIFRKPFLATVILLSLLSVFLGQPRGMQTITVNPVDTIRLVRILLLVVLAITSIIVIALTIKPGTTLGWGIIAMAIYALHAMGSSLYSFVPLLTLWKGFEVLAITFVGMLIAIMLEDADDIQHVFNIVYIAISYLIISAIVGAIFNPGEAFAKMQVKGLMAFALQGIYPFINSNTLSQVSAILCAIALVWIVRPEKKYNKIGPIIVLLVSSACLVMSHSRTSIFALLLVVLLILFIYRRMMMLFFMVWVFAILSLSGMVLEYIKPYILRGQKTVLFKTMTGRLEFWPEVLEKIWKAPILGHGFYSSQRLMWNISSVDNTYLEVILGIGIVGLLIFLIPTTGIIINLWKTRPWRIKESLNSQIRFLWIQMASIYIILIIRSLTGPSFQNLHINLIIFVILVVSTYRLRKISYSFRIRDKGE